MYTRSDISRRRTSVPDNYGGTAFSDEKEAEEFIPPPSESELCSSAPSCKVNCSHLPIRAPLFGLEAEDLLLLGIIFLLAQSDTANDIIPLLIILLLC